MANILKYNDFIGRYEISQNSQKKTHLEDYIAEFEPIYLEALLGAYLYNLLKADLNSSGVPQTQKYKDLVNGVTWVDSCNVTLNFKGLKCMLKQLIFVDYTLHTYYNSNIGNVKPVAENATVLSDLENKKILVPISQDAVHTYRSCVKFLKDDKNYLTYFTIAEFSLWEPQTIYPLSIISTRTLENLHFKNYPNDTN